MSYRIVVGVDGSEHGREALRWALEEARLRDAQLTALLAWQMPFIGIPGAFEREELERMARELLLGELGGVGIERVGTNDGVEVNAVVAQGDPSASLLELCNAVGADLLVLGSRGREGFRALRLGSVGQECAAHARCPVAIVKWPANGRTPAADA